MTNLLLHDKMEHQLKHFHNEMIKLLEDNDELEAHEVSAIIAGFKPEDISKEAVTALGRMTTQTITAAAMAMPATATMYLMGSIMLDMWLCGYREGQQDGKLEASVNGS